jgi:GH35 family endo-1,4-beta-xylanase
MRTALGRSDLSRALIAILVVASAFACAARAGPQDVASRVERKLKEIQELTPRWIESGRDPGAIQPLGAEIERAIQAGDPARVVLAADRLLAILRPPDGDPDGTPPPPAQLKVYDAAGRPISQAELTPRSAESMVTGVYALDEEYDAVPMGILEVSDGLVTLAPTVPKPLRIHFFARVDGFGKLKLFVDDGGGGYMPPARGEWVLDLPLEAARSRVAKVERLVSGEPAVPFRPATLTRLRAARQHLATAARGKDVDAGQVYSALREALWAGEMAALDLARENIRKQIPRHDFRIGGFLSPDFETWQEPQKALFARLFDVGTLKTFFLGGYEAEAGRPRPEESERQLQYLARNGIPAKGHPLVYLIEPNIPGWLSRLSPDQVMEAMRARILRDVGRFKGRIRIWDVINEPNSPNPLCDQSQMVALARVAAESTRQADPEAVRVVNFCLPSGDVVADPLMASLVKTGRVQTPRKFLGALRREGVEYEAIGVQLYYCGLDMLELSLMLDRYGRLGKSVHVTEVGVSAAPGVDRQSRHFQDQARVEALGEWHAPWSEAIQAEWTEQVYTIAHSKPYVHSITWVDLWDDFWPFGGLMRRDRTPRPVVDTMEQMFRSWRTGR